ncbi:MAG: TRAP transporter large permease subunit [Deltaproteobacteria bacterium]|nr:TRAP transporter large permease subunit [Deltaproteobacteria bacterium]
MDVNIFVVFAILIALLVGSLPVFAALFFTSFISLVLYTDVNPVIMAHTMAGCLKDPSLLVMLFFILTGNIMTQGSTATKLINIAQTAVGFLPGGLAMAGCLACSLFGFISGSTVATVVAIGGIMIPAMIDNGYDEKFTLGIMTSSPVLGIIVPPSITMVIYASVTNCSIAQLFLTGFIPAGLIVISFSIYTFFCCRAKGMTRKPWPGPKDLLRVLREGIWALMLPVIIFAGILSGALTIIDAAVLSSVYAFVVELFIHRSMKFSDIIPVTINSALLTSALLIIVAGATTFGSFLTLQRIPDMVAQAVTTTITQPWMFLLIINALLFFIGMFMDPIPATLILTPIILPTLAKFHIDIVHFGLIMTLNLGISYITPPIGTSLFITGAMRNRDIVYVTESILPFLLIQVAILILLSYLPQVTLFLPKLFYG